MITTRRFTITILLALLLLPLATVVNAQDSDDAKRQQWFKEMRAKKHEFLARELELTDQQKAPFFDAYDRLEENMKAVADRVRTLEHSLKNKSNPTDADYDAVIEAIYHQRYDEWTIENQAREALSKILTKHQLIKLKKAEHRFTRMLMKQHNNQKRPNK